MPVRMQKRSVGSGLSQRRSIGTVEQRGSPAKIEAEDILHFLLRLLTSGQVSPHNVFAPPAGGSFRLDQGRIPIQRGLSQMGPSALKP